MEDLNNWLDILHDRIQEFQMSSDQLSLATAYNQLRIIHYEKHQDEDGMNS